MPKSYNIFLMSATFPKKVLNMVYRIMYKYYCYITHGNFLGEKEEANENIKQRFYLVEIKPKR
jgi:superfamily II DNA/RNA helicase